MASAPTKDPAAYDLFLKGEFEQRAALNALTPELFDQAITWYREAIARDPNFALAMARLAVCRMRRHWLAESATESELLEIGKMAKDALTLAPNLAEAHVALGVFHYYGFRDYEPALAEFKRAIELQPNNAEALQFSAYVYRRQGQWDRALDGLERSLKQDPRNASVTGNVAQTYCFLRRWKETESTARHALTLDPHEATSMGMLLLSRLNLDGNEKEALRVLATFPSDDMLVPNGGTFVMVIGRRAEAFVLNRDFNAALKTWETGPGATSGERQRLSAKTTIRVLAGDMTGARADADRARELLEARLLEHPGEVRSMRALSWAYLALNRNDDAIKIARQALELLPLEKDAGLGPANLASLAEIQARTGATSDAVSNLRRLLSIPAGEAVSIARLKIDPVWDPIRNDPGFQQLLAVKDLSGPKDMRTDPLLHRIKTPQRLARGRVLRRERVAARAGGDAGLSLLPDCQLVGALDHRGRGYRLSLLGSLRLVLSMDTAGSAARNAGCAFATRGAPVSPKRRSLDHGDAIRGRGFVADRQVRPARESRARSPADPKNPSPSCRSPILAAIPITLSSPMACRMRF